MRSLQLALMLFFALQAGAHTLPISYLTVVCDEEFVHLELTLNPFELNSISDSGQNTNDARLARQILSCLTLRVDGKALRAETAGLTPDVDSHHLTLRAHYRADARRAALSVTSSLATITSGSHLTQVTCVRNGRQELAQLDAQSMRVTLAAPSLTRAQAGSRAASAAFGSLLLLLAIPGMTVFAIVFVLIRKSLRPVGAGG